MILTGDLNLRFDEEFRDLSLPGYFKQDNGERTYQSFNSYVETGDNVAEISTVYKLDYTYY